MQKKSVSGAARRKTVPPKRKSGSMAMRELEARKKQISRRQRERDELPEQVRAAAGQTSRKKNSGSSFIVQGGILAVAGIIARILGMIKRIPLTNIIGDVGNGYYGIAYEVYNIVLLISSYSLPLAVSKLVSVRVSRGEYRNANRVFRMAMLFAFLTGGIACILVLTGGDFLAGTVMLEPMSAMALRVLGPTLFLVAIMGVMRGYYQGLGTMMPTAVSQVVEQICLVIVSLLSASVLFKYGTKVGALLHNENFAPAYGAAGGAMGTVAGALVGLLFLMLIYKAYYPKFRRQMKREQPHAQESSRQLLRLLVMTIVPVLLSTAVYNVSTVIDQYIYGHVMVAQGLGDIKTYNWGVFSGKYRVLVNIPIAFANAMCSSIVPSLTPLIEAGEISKARAKVGQGIRFTMFIAIPCAVGLGVLAKPIISTLFRGEITLAAQMMWMGSISVIFYGLSTLSNGILQAINKMHVPVRNALIALVIHVAALYVMLEFLHMQIFGVVAASVLFAMIMCILNSLSIRKYIRYRQEMNKTFLIPAAASLIMGAVCFFAQWGLQKVVGVRISTVLAILLGAVVYLFLLIVMRGISEKELRSFPGGKVLVRICRTVHLF